ncbi:MAG: GTP-binding protein [Flavobacteriales bacterium]|nr:GTP-binding protein [Flavobacteriales bacterium]
MIASEVTRLPVHIISGFLGAGKTTFLNHFIKARRHERILVIENECGDTNVDGAIVFEGVEEVVELTSGCLCCSLSDGLIDILALVAKRKDEFDRVVIETTGIADPSSIMQVFLSDPRVERVFELQQMTCLADASLLEEWLAEAEEALRQIAIADVILINKIDTAGKDQLQKLKKTLEGINPHAYVMEGEYGIFNVDDILKIGTTHPESVEVKISENTADNHVHHDNDHNHHQDHTYDPHHHHGNEHHHDHNSHGITTFTLTFDGVFDLDALSLELYKISNLYRSQVYRVKGIIAIPNYENMVILQSVRSSFVATDGRAWKDDEIRISKLVFIGRGLRKDVFQKMFGKYIIKEPVNL